VLGSVSMRRCTLLLLFLPGCASVASPTADPSREASANEDANLAAAIGSDPAPQSSDNAATASADGDASNDGAPSGTDGGPFPDASDPWPIDATDEGWSSPESAPPFDPGEGGVCTAPPCAGDLVIDELMIESVAGAGDHGEWLEIESTIDCALDLRGLHGDVPSGSKVRTFQIGDDLWIPARGTLVVADSSNASINHDLPGTVATWSAQPGDVLRNKGGTVTLHMNGVVLDTLTYPSMTLSVGASVAFPADCPLSRRTDWTAWQTSTASWFPGFVGTPNAPNTDVQCP
jgi:hypothetical protein